MKNPQLAWSDLIGAARSSGYQVHQDEGAWFITTPARPRNPAQELGSYKTERDAWHGAAHLHHQDDKQRGRNQ